MNPYESNQEPRPMTSTPKNHWRVVAFALVGLALVAIGLLLAVFSNPICTQ